MFFKNCISKNIFIKRCALSVFWLLTDYILNHIVSHIPFWLIRKAYMSLCGAKIGGGSQFDMDTVFLDINRLKVGKHSHINRNCLIDARGELMIADNVSISQRVVIMSMSHDYRSPDFKTIKSRIIIDNYVWIGVNATIIGDVHIGEGAVVCAGAVVTKDVEPYTVVAGVPATVIRTRPKTLRYTILDGIYPFPQFV